MHGYALDLRLATGNFNISEGSTLTIGMNVTNTAGTLSVTWTGDTSNEWGNTNNWSAGVPNATGASAIFTSASPSGYDIFLGAAGRTANITFNSTTGSTPYTIKTYDTDGTTRRTLSIGGVTVQTGRHAIQGAKGFTNAVGDLILQNNAAFDIASGATLTLDARLRSSATSNDFTKTGAGTLVLSANNGGSNAWQFNSATTGFSVNGGVLRFAAANATGNSGNKFIVASDAAMEVAGNIGLTLNTNGAVTLNGNGIGSTGALRSTSGTNNFNGSGLFNLASNASIGVDADSLSISQTFQGTGSLTKVGAGTLTPSFPPPRTSAPATSPTLASPMPRMWAPAAAKLTSPTAVSRSSSSPSPMPRCLAASVWSCSCVAAADDLENRI